MVLPASPADDAPAQAERELLERLRLIFRLASGGVLVLVERARPERLGPFVRAVLSLEPELQVFTSALKLPVVPKGTPLVLVPDLAHAVWMNLERPLFMQKAFRVLLFCDEATSAGLAHEAPDFFNWISHWMECPPGAWGPAVLGIRGAAAAAGPGLVWQGGDLEEAFAEALPGQVRVRVSAALPYGELLEAIQSAGEAWVEVGDIDGLFRLRRVRWAVAEAGRTGRVLLLEPAVTAPGFWPVHAKVMAPKEACRILEEAGAKQAGRLAALLDLEPEAVETAARLLRAGVGEEEIDAVLRTTDDAGAAMGRLAEERGVQVAAGTPLRWRAGIEGGDAGGDAAERAIWRGKWAEAAWEAVSAGDPAVAEGWARRATHERGEWSKAQRALARALLDMGRLTEAANALAQAETEHLQQGEGASLQFAHLSHAFGVVLKAQGDLTGARRRLERALAIKENAYRTDEHPDVAESVRELAQVLRMQGDLAGARRQLERLVATETHACGTEEHRRVAAALHALAGVLHDLGDLAGARRHIEQALAIKVKAYGTDEHPDVAASLHELAMIMREQGELSGARRCIEWALAIGAKVYGTHEHPRVAASLYELGNVLHAQGDLAGARRRLERAVDIWTNLYGSDEHPHVAASLHALAQVLHAQGDLEGARKHMERVLEIDGRIYGTREHHAIARSEAVLGVVLLQLGERGRGLDLLRHAHDTLLAQLGPDHPETQDVADLLSRVAGPAAV